MRLQKLMYFLLFAAIVVRGYYVVKAQSKLKAVARVSGSCTLNGSGSYDPNKGGKIVSYHWRKVSGASCVVVSPDSVITVVNGLHKGMYVFSLTVKNNFNLSDVDSTNVTVKVK